MADVDSLIATIEGHGAALKSLGYRVRFTLTDLGESILLDATGGDVTVSQDAGEADSVLSLTSDNLSRLIAGKLSPMLAFTTGKLKVDGSRGVAMKLASLLDQG